MWQAQQHADFPLPRTTSTSCGSISMKRSQNTVLVSAALLLSASASVVDGFSSLRSSHVTRKLMHRVAKDDRPGLFRDSAARKDDVYCGLLHASSDNDERTESRIGVRRRVRSVLEKARNRTGIKNNSEEKMLQLERRKQGGVLRTEQTGLDVIADAASIGGLGAVVVDAEMGSIDVAIDYAPNKNGADKTTQLLANGTQLIDNPEDDFFVAAPNAAKKRSAASPKADAIKADVSAAFSVPAAPLPFTLPSLTKKQTKQLEAGERIQMQTKMAREGSGYVVVDVKAPPYVIWECLLDFESYPETIPTVRDVRMYTSTNLKSGYHAEKPVNPGTGKETRHYGTPSLTRAAFSLSKFKLKIAAVHKYRPHPVGDYMIFELDKSSSNMVLQKAKGVWHTEAEVREGYTRVWLLCELKVSRALPSFIVDYAAKRAMPRATTWLKPQVEAAAELWLKNDIELNASKGQ